MNDLETRDLARALVRLLGGRERRPRIRTDREGWVGIAEVCVAASQVLDRHVVADQVRHVATLRVTLDEPEGTDTFELSGTRMRLRARARPRPAPLTVPDLLFHATTTHTLSSVAQRGELRRPDGRPILLSPDEGQAWRAAHRAAGDGEAGEPAVLVIDAIRARRQGVRFQRHKSTDLLTAPAVPLLHLLNLRDGFDAQLSAGGIPLRREADGSLRMALIQVARRSGTTWEVAKGKLELGETPESAAIREVREEMGLTAPLDVLRFVGPVRYGFLAPGGSPRLKTIFLYLLAVRGEAGPFLPAANEGIGEVAWFTPDEAVAAVSHTSLLPVMRLARELTLRHGDTPAEAYRRPQER